MHEGIYDAEFTYGPDNERVKTVLKENGQTVSTRYYFGSCEELHMEGGPVYAIQYLKGGAMYVTTDGAGGQFSYSYKDHLGSLLAVTDAQGNIVGEQSFGAWGGYRDPDSWAALNYSTLDEEILPWLSRGYTGHEHLRQFELINQNALPIEE